MRPTMCRFIRRGILTRSKGLYMCARRRREGTLFCPALRHLKVIKGPGRAPRSYQRAFSTLYRGCNIQRGSQGQVLNRSFNKSIAGTICNREALRRLQARVRGVGIPFIAGYSWQGPFWSFWGGQGVVVRVPRALLGSAFSTVLRKFPSFRFRCSGFVIYSRRVKVRGLHGYPWVRYFESCCVEGRCFCL